MRRKTLIVLAVITVPTALAAAFVPKPAITIETPVQGGPILPGLKAGIDAAATLTVAGPDGTVTLARKPVAGKIDRAWTLSDKGGYPVDPAKIKPVLDGLIALHGVEPNPASSSTSCDPHCGHASGRSLPAIRRTARPFGATMPSSRNASRPVSLIQSVVHGGSSCT